jgi:type IV secretory pathway VirB10-like protein
MKRGQLTAVIIIVLFVAAVGAFYVFSEKRAGRAALQPAPIGITYSREGTNTAPQPTQAPPPQPTQQPTVQPTSPPSTSSKSSAITESEYEKWKKEKPKWPLCRPLPGFDDCNPPPARYAQVGKFVCKKGRCLLD